MALDYSKTVLFEGTHELGELKEENYNLIGLNSILVLSIMILGTIIAFKNIQVNSDIIKVKKDL